MSRKEEIQKTYYDRMKRDDIVLEFGLHNSQRVIGSIKDYDTDVILLVDLEQREQLLYRDYIYHVRIYVLRPGNEERRMKNEGVESREQRAKSEEPETNTSFALRPPPYALRPPLPSSICLCLVLIHQGFESHYRSGLVQRTRQSYFFIPDASSFQRVQRAKI